MALNVIVALMLLTGYCQAYPNQGYNSYNSYEDYILRQLINQARLEEQSELERLQDLYNADKAAPQVPVPVEDKTFDTNGQGIGMISGVAVDSSDSLFIFHRADRPWTAESFEQNANVLSAEGKKRIQKETIYKVDGNGKVLKKFGGNLFNVPHGLNIDGNDNLWLTDVGRHQVFRIPKNSTTPDLILGEQFVPGNDTSHFCKPTDVAVLSNGDFFVSDGYCNTRVLKFDKNGKFIAQWGKPDTQSSVPGSLDHFTLSTPHSVTLVEAEDLICVADRENERALCYNAGIKKATDVGKFVKIIIPEKEIKKVFSIYYNKAAGNIVAAGEISRTPINKFFSVVYPNRAFTYSMDGSMLAKWAPITPEIARVGPTLIHDLCVTSNGKYFYLSDIVQDKVFKYTIP